MKAFVLVSGIMMLMTGFAVAAEKPSSYPLQSKEAQVPEKKAEPDSVIKGTATMQLKSQNKSILNRMELVLCPADIAPKVKETRDERWRINASRAKFNDGYNILDLNAIGMLAVRSGGLRAKSDEKGQFRFEKVPAGSYVIYGQYRSNYAVAYWLVPVKVGKGGEDITMDLNESNVKEAYNRF
jgi:hypothetical protein